MACFRAERRSGFPGVITVLAILAVTVTAVASCGGTAPSGYKPPEGEDFSKLPWSQAFEKLYEKFSKEYAFTDWKGINWKSLYEKYRPRIQGAEAASDGKAYYLALREFTQQMRDGHVSIKPDNTDVLKEMAGGGFGLTAVKLDDGRVVAPWIKPEGPAAAAGMTAGAQILQWGGKPVKTALAETSTVLGPSQPTNARVEYEKLRFLVRAPVGTRKVVSFKNRGENASRTVTLEAVDDQGETLVLTDGRSILNLIPFPERMIEKKTLADNVGYIRILGEVDMPREAKGDHTPTLELFRGAVNSFIDGKAAGLVIDIRGNSGGSDQMVADFLASFYDQKTFYEYQNYIVPATGEFEIWVADDVTGEYSSPGRGIAIEPLKKRFTGPVVALVNNGCISSGEGIAMGIKNLPNGEVVGFYGTNGSFGMAGDGALMPGGYTVEWPFGQSLDSDKVVQIDSKRGKGGVAPDKRIPVTLENAIGAAEGRDVELEYALEVLRRMR